MRRLQVVGLVVVVGCSGGPASPGASEATSEATAGTGETAATTAGSSSTTSGDSTTEAVPTTSTDSSSTTSEPVNYCQGFERDAPAPFFELAVMGGAPLVDGAVLPLECGGQGLWMFGLYPSLGGFDPGGYHPQVSVVVDVEGYNIGPTGHFYQRDGESYYIGCEQLDGGVTGVIPVFPPDELAKLAEVDGLAAQVHVEVDTPDGPLAVDALVTLSAPPELVELGCVL
ncbi:hypothetical protein [Nannocystis pusilla]|uniref:hypothetical protein n=1 Tax=Nannocystis pusilla TaxID=889268 RepID=UPI003DA4783B